MAYLTAGVENALHCLLWLVDGGEAPLSSRDLADLQGISPTFLAKTLAKLEKAGVVRAADGVRGGYLLARPAQDISFLDVVDAVEGDKSLFECREIRAHCVLFGERAPRWATVGVCAIHQVMLRAEKAMRDTLAQHSLADIGHELARKAPTSFPAEVQAWLQNRHALRPGTGKKYGAHNLRKRAD